MMAKSTTKKLTKTGHKALATLTTIAKAEMSHSMGNGLPPTIKISDTSYLVGEYSITKINDEWVVSHKHSQPEAMITFQAAMVFAVAASVGDREKTSAVKLATAKLKLLLSDAARYVIIMNRVKSSDQWKFDMIMSRYSNALAHIHQAEEELAKILLLGKYNILGKITT